MVVPDVALVEADSDEEAVEYARTSRSFTTREIWDRHRLVAVIPSRQARVA
jgi:IMP cyclohydrolase